MSKRMLQMLALLVIIFGSIFGYNLYKIRQAMAMGANYKPPAVSVTALTVKLSTWESYLTAVGNLTAANGANISAAVSGLIKTINFTAGNDVKAGDLLLQLDDDIDQATLLTNLADLKLAQVDFSRRQKLYVGRAISKAELDKAQAELARAQGNVARTQAVIQQKHITAPFAGRPGIGNYGVGEFVAAGSTLLSLQAMDPLNVKFAMPGSALQHIATGQAINVLVPAYPDKTYPGKISALNSIVSKVSHNIEIRGKLPNEKNALYPGMFARIRVMLPSKPQAIVIPQTAVEFTLFGDSVFIIRDNKAYRLYIKTGERRDDVVEVLSGLKAGDHIVTTGQLKLHDGTDINVITKK